MKWPSEIIRSMVRLYVLYGYTYIKILRARLEFLEYNLIFLETWRLFVPGFLYRVKWESKPTCFRGTSAFTFCLFAYWLAHTMSLRLLARSYDALRTRGIQERPNTFTGAILLGYILVRYWNTWYVHGNKIISTWLLHRRSSNNV